MFDSNTDLEFDDIFGDSFQPDPPGAPKHIFENENSSVETSKKLCLDRKAPAIPARSATFLKEICDNLNVSSGAAVSSPLRSESLSSSSLRLESKHDPFSPPIKKVVLRKFPGPAGLLPERKGFDTGAMEEANTKETKQVDMDIFSQMSVRAFPKGPWEQMKKDFSACGPNMVFLPDKYNVAWIKAKVKANKLINQKAPFLAAIVQKIECVKLKTHSVTMLLKDATGQIHSTIVHDLYEDHRDDLKVGSVVILKQFGVLTMDHGSNHYLTITANNLVTIYSEKSTSQNDFAHSDDHSAADVKVTNIQKLSVEDFLKNINEVKSNHQSALLERKLNPGLEFGGIDLSLKSLSEGNTSACRTEASKVQKIEPKTVHNDKYILPSCNSLTIRNKTNSSVAVKCNESVSSNSNSFSSTCSNFINNSMSNVNLNTENKAGILTNASSKPRFNFKACVGNVSNNNGAVQLPAINNTCENSNIFPLGNKKFLVNPQLIKPETVTGVINNADKSKSKPILINENKTKNLSQSASNNRSSVIKCSQISVTSSSLEHSAILQNVFEGVDIELLFGDF